MAAPTFKFRDRDVRIDVVTFGDIMDANRRQEETGNQQDALWYVTHRAAKYADDNSLVFATPDDIRNASAKEAGSIMRMSSEAARLNMPNVEELKDPT